MIAPTLIWAISDTGAVITLSQPNGPDSRATVGVLVGIAGSFRRRHDGLVIESVRQHCAGAYQEPDKFVLRGAAVIKIRSLESIQEDLTWI